MLEQEVKFRLSLPEDGRRLLDRHGATLEKSRHLERNALFDFSDARLSKRDEALRVRQVGADSWLTFKGPQHGTGRVKQRRELESFVSDGAAVTGLLEALGLEPCFRYEKYRATYRLGDAVLTLDETPIGTFLEIEATPECIEDLAGRLALDLRDAIILSYPRLYERYRLEVPEAPDDMVFDEPGPATSS